MKRRRLGSLEVSAVGRGFLTAKMDMDALDTDDRRRDLPRHKESRPARAIRSRR